MTRQPADPTETRNLDGYGHAPLDWSRVIESLDGLAEAEPNDPFGRYFMATTNADGSPHVTGLGVVWFEGTFWFVAGAGTVKARNLRRDPRCSVSVATSGLDIVAEGEAAIVREQATLERLAERYAGWGPQVKDGAFWHEYNAPSAGPPPWDLYEMTIRTVYAVATEEPHGATRWRF
jgi:hypothetical protein